MRCARRLRGLAAAPGTHGCGPKQVRLGRGVGREKRGGRAGAAGGLGPRGRPGLRRGLHWRWVLLFGAFQGVQHFHTRRYHGIVLNALVIVIGLLQYLVNFAAQSLLCRRQVAKVWASTDFACDFV